MDFMELKDKTIVVFGVANRKSIAWNVGQSLEACGANVVYVVRSEQRRESLKKIMGDREVYCCDVERDEEIQTVQQAIAEKHPTVHGLLHSIAFADYEGGIKPFHETGKHQFLRTMDVSCYSFIAIANAFKPILDRAASVVTMSISTTRMASESYGFMAPVKAALDSSLAFLTKSFSADSEVRFNAVGAGLLKTSASAGIPGYVDSYLYAEQVIPRHRALETREAADTAVFLLSPRSSGIVAQTIVVDAGMSINYFDASIVKRVMGSSN